MSLLSWSPWTAVPAPLSAMSITSSRVPGLSGPAVDEVAEEEGLPGARWGHAVAGPGRPRWAPPGSEGVRRGSARLVAAGLRGLSRRRRRAAVPALRAEAVEAAAARDAGRAVQDRASPEVPGQPLATPRRRARGESVTPRPARRGRRERREAERARAGPSQVQEADPGDGHVRSRRLVHRKGPRRPSPLRGPPGRGHAVRPRKKPKVALAAFTDDEIFRSISSIRFCALPAHHPSVHIVISEAGRRRRTSHSGTDDGANRPTDKTTSTPTARPRCGSAERTTRASTLSTPAAGHAERAPTGGARPCDQ